MTEAFDFTLTATWVDRWGRQGPTSEPLRIHDGGSSGGCSTVAAGGPQSGSAAWMLVIAGLWMLGQRRRSLRR
ncbi:MAG: hypothetical protein H0U74_15040 [Bradymonadaceae bacterium]|nr:hypothetical protein [Lujinxingiaceae bacterium]